MLSRLSRTRSSSLSFQLSRGMVQNQKRAISSTKARKQDAPPGYVADPSAGPMLRYQESLPKLPVPPLSSTLSKYTETVQPHLTAEEFSKTQAAVKKFAESPLAQELQKRLEARAAEPGMKNWLADWWNDVAYMAYRDSVVVNVSYFYVHKDDPRIRDAPARAARLIKALLPFRDLVESGQLEPERVKTAPLCMASYKWLFNSSRYPTKPSDTARKFDPATNNHVVFIRKNKFYEFPVTHGGSVLSTSELEAQIRKVIELAGSEKATPIGVLTSENRDNWTDAREALLAANAGNAAALERIESAIVVVCLDDSNPVTREDISWACWTGDGRNRFYDKHQFVVFDNGRSGFLGEHSCMDGTPTLRLNEFMLASLAANKVEHGHSSRSDIPPPREITFNLDPKSRQFIASAEKNFDDLIGSQELTVLHYEGYGKDYIKTHRTSPDAWVQLVKQLAFHKLAGRPGVCYESCQTRKFQLGRTEVIRSASNESREWAEAMLKHDESNVHRENLFRRAVGRHLQYAAWAADGQGIDRHLFGLKRLLKEGEEMPEIYTDPTFARTSHWELSTSQLSSPFIDGWGYGEVVPDGYGLSYAIGNDHIRWTITARKVGPPASVEVLRHYLAEAATELRQVMDAAARDKANAAAGAKAKAKL